MAAAPHSPCIPPEMKAELILSEGHAKPANRENSGEMPRSVSWRPHAVLLSIKQRAMQITMAVMKEALRGEGLKIEGRRAPLGMKGVANRFSVWLLAGPEIKPSINGIIAADAINEVKRKSALRRIFSRADKSAITPDAAKASTSAINTAITAACHDKSPPVTLPEKNSPDFANNKALVNPPR